MKNAFFIIFCVTTINAFAQQKVYRTDDFEKLVMDEEKQQLAYPELGEDVFANNRNELIRSAVEARQLHDNFYKYAYLKGVQFEEFKKKSYVPIEILCNAEGKIDYLIYGYKVKFEIKGIDKKALLTNLFDKEEEQVFKNLAEEFFKTVDLSSLGQKRPFEFSLNLRFGADEKVKKAEKLLILKTEDPEKIKELKLNDLYLHDFPKEIFRFKNLERIDLSNNFIDHIPNKFWRMKKLKFVSLSGNPINYSSFRFKRNKTLKDLNLQFTNMTQIPRTIGRNKNLELLFIGNNRLNSLRDKDFTKLQQLKTLNLYNVSINSLPKTIENLKNLEEIDLYHNDLKALPDEICQLLQLKTLAVANNDLWNLPTNINKLTNLKQLFVHHNRLNFLPDLPDLKLLDIGYNLFKTFPEQIYTLSNIEELDIRYNQLSELPIGILGFKKIQKIYIKGNDFEENDDLKAKYATLVADLESKQVLVR